MNTLDLNNIYLFFRYNLYSSISFFIKYNVVALINLSMPSRPYQTLYEARCN